MEKDRDYLDNLIIKFLRETASKSEIKQLELLLTRDPQNKIAFEETVDIWNRFQLANDLDSDEIQKDFEKILAKTRSTKTKRIPRNSLITNWTLRAAIFLILGFGSFWLWNQSRTTETIHDIEFRTVTTSIGDTEEVTLPDGSTITLNSESKLTYPSKFSEEIREIYFEGEALFKIEPDESKGFIAKTQDLAIKVYGTTFNVKSYPLEETVETTLLEGSISLYELDENGELSGSETRIDPNDHVVYYKTERNTTFIEKPVKRGQKIPAPQPKLVFSNETDATEFISWIYGELRFQREPLPRLAATLERRYNVKIEFEGKDIHRHTFTGSFKNETLEQILEAMKLAAQIDYEILDEKVILRKVN